MAHALRRRLIRGGWLAGEVEAGSDGAKPPLHRGDEVVEVERLAEVIEGADAPCRLRRASTGGRRRAARRSRMHMTYGAPMGTDARRELLYSSTISWELAERARVPALQLMQALGSRGASSTNV